MNIAQNLIKYALEGLAVAIAAHYIPKRGVDVQDVAMIAFTAAAMFLVLDLFAPGVANGARMGAGFGIGAQQVGFGRSAMSAVPLMEPMTGAVSGGCDSCVVGGADCGSTHDPVAY